VSRLLENVDTPDSLAERVSISEHLDDNVDVGVRLYLLERTESSRCELIAEIAMKTRNWEGSDLLCKGCYEPLFMRNQTGGGFRRSRNALPNPWLKRW
jgi:hypothetical protein